MDQSSDKLVCSIVSYERSVSLLRRLRVTLALVAFGAYLIGLQVNHRVNGTDEVTVGKLEAKLDLHQLILHLLDLLVQRSYLWHLTHLLHCHTWTSVTLV